MLWTRRRQRRGNAPNQQLFRQDPRDNNGNGDGGVPMGGEQEQDENNQLYIGNNHL